MSGRDGVVPVMDEAFWDERYRSRGAWDGEPNEQLIAEIAERPPGRALDAGTGDGADAIWLAERGWQVIAADISPVALQRGAEAARAAGAETAARITWQHLDLTTQAPPECAFDLVAAHFVHLPQPARDLVHRRLAAAVVPGGTLLVVAHHPSDLQTTIRRPPLPELFCTGDEIVAVLDPQCWIVEQNEARPRTVTDPEGAPVTIHDVIVRARRRA